jgi:hypothetical protein
MKNDVKNNKSYKLYQIFSKLPIFCMFSEILHPKYTLGIPD